MKKNAQSLLELSILGALFITLMGVLIHYGLRYNFQQQIMQQAFRKALGMASEKDAEGYPKGQASYVYIKDRHITDPSSPFGVGSVMPTSSSASVTRDYRLHETADTEEELPKLTMNIPNRKNGKFEDQILEYKTADFGDYCISEECDKAELKKYEEIFGATNVWEEDEVSCAAGKGIRIIDACEGELMGYDGCKRQCRMITDTSFCIRECKKGRLSESENKCSEICSASIETPWYCDKLDTLFSFAIAESKPKAMGLQQDYTQVSTRDNVSHKTESAAGISVTDTLNWSDTFVRRIIFRPKGDKTGAYSIQDVTNIISRDDTLNWQTGGEGKDEGN